jgi:hypothetical protein
MSGITKADERGIAIRNRTVSLRTQSGPCWSCSLISTHHLVSLRFDRLGPYSSMVRTILPSSRNDGLSCLGLRIAKSKTNVQAILPKTPLACSVMSGKGTKKTAASRKDDEQVRMESTSLE